MAVAEDQPVCQWSADHACHQLSRADWDITRVSHQVEIGVI
jgi:hypothetical protein